jgi:hypothetical protein
MVGVPVLVLMVVPLDLVRTRHDEDAPVQMHHLDLRAVQTRQYRAGDHLVHRPQGGLAAAEIENLVHCTEQRVEFVRAEKDGQPEFLLQTADKFHHSALVVRIEADQRLVEEQETRAAEQGLGEEQPLALAAGQLAERPPGETGRADQAEDPLDIMPPGGVQKRQSPAVAVDRRGDEIPAAQPGRRDRAAGLRHVADRRISARGRCTEDADAPGRRTKQAQDRTHHRGLPGTVRAEHTDERVLGDDEIHPRKDIAAAQLERDAFELDGVQGAGFASAASSASSCEVIQVW